MMNQSSNVHQHVKLHPGVDTWDSRLNSLLDDDQKELIAALAAASYERPYPKHLLKTSSASHVNKNASNYIERTGVGDDGDNEEADADFFNIDEKVGSNGGGIESLPMLEMWFKGIQDTILDEKELKIWELKKENEENLSVLNSLIDEIQQCDNEVKELRNIYDQVSYQTNTLHSACERLLDEESDLMNAVSTISHKLNYFNEYDKIMQKLNSPIFSAKSGSFNNLLQRIEECIEYLTENSNYKESSNYLMLYRSAHSKALVMMKTHFHATLSAASDLKSLNSSTTQTTTTTHSTQNVEESSATSEVKDGHVGEEKKTGGNAPSPVTSIIPIVNANNSFSLLYGKFRAISSSMKVLIEQLEERQSKFAECQQILDDCETIYFSCRQSLVGDSVMAGVNDLLLKHKSDHCGLFRNGTFMILQVCVDEWDLYQHFFSKPSEKLNSFLQMLCNYLYDALRPLIVHIIHLETLAELCGILKSELLGDKIFSLKDRIGVFELTCKQMLEDIQERLVYRTQMYIKSDIVGYNPVSGDLAYPEKLIMMREIAQSLNKQATERSPSFSDTSASETVVENDANEDPQRSSDESSEFKRKDSSESVSSSSAILSVSPADIHGMWYPTLRRTLVCLSKLYRCLDIDIFRGLAQETIGCCVQSLLFASQKIASSKSQIDANLFFIKHLLILREQIQPFHSEFYVTETVLDFSKTRLAALGLFNQRERLFSLNRTNALLQFLIDGSPQVTELTVDSKKDVDMQLKKYCEIFVDHCCKTLCDPLLQFLEKAKVLIEVIKEGHSKMSLRQQPFASCNKLQDIVGSSNKLIKSQLPKLKDKMSLYLANRDTEAILFRPIMTKIVKCYSDVSDILNQHYNEEDRHIIGLPSTQEISLLLS